MDGVPGDGVPVDGVPVDGVPVPEVFVPLTEAVGGVGSPALCHSVNPSFCS